MTHESDRVCAALRDAIGDVDVAIHVGCGDGYELTWLKAKRKYGIDAHPDTRPLSGFFAFHSLAIGLTEGPVTLYGAGSPPLASLLNRGGEKITVEGCRLDTFCRSQGIERIDVLIVDTEGTTPDVLMSTGALLNTLRFLYCEVQTGRHPHCEANDALVDALATEAGMVRRTGEPEYDAGAQANRMYVRPNG